MKQKVLLVFVLGFMTALVSCIESKDNAIQTEEPQFKVEQEAFKWDFKYDGKVYLDPRINKNIITTFDELMPNQQPAIDEETEVVVISRLDGMDGGKMGLPEFQTRPHRPRALWSCPTPERLQGSLHLQYPGPRREEVR